MLFLQVHQIAVPPYSLEEILSHKAELPGIKHPLPFFADYLKKGYYPFALEEGFDLRLQQIVNQTLETDIPLYAGMNVSTGRKLKQLLAIIAKGVPFKPNMTSIATALSASRNSIADYCLFILSNKAHHKSGNLNAAISKALRTTLNQPFTLSSSIPTGQ
jgi:hypothetical protein